MIFGLRTVEVVKGRLVLTAIVEDVAEVDARLGVIGIELERATKRADRSFVITKPVDLAAEFLGVAVDAFGVTRLGAEAHTSIDRKDFNVTFNVPLDGGKLLIGDKVDITLAIEAVRA